MKLAQSKKKYANPTRKAYPYYIRTFIALSSAEITRFHLVFSLSSDGHVKDDLPSEHIAGHAKRPRGIGLFFLVCASEHGQLHIAHAARRQRVAAVIRQNQHGRNLGRDVILLSEKRGMRV